MTTFRDPEHSEAGETVEFRLLGPVEARAGDRPIRLGAPMVRLVLAALLLAEGRPLTPRELADRLWDGDPPETGPDLLRDYLKKVRRHLENGAPGAGALLPRYDGGYRVVVPRSRVDVHRFNDGVAEAGGLAGRDDMQAAARYRTALAEWHADVSGQWDVEPLAGLPGSWAEAQRVTLRAKRRGAFIDCAKAELRLGGHEQRLVPELPLLLDAGLPDEQLAELLMIAYVQAGRRGDALNVFAHMRERLLEELGSDPGPSLEGLRQRILAEDPDLTPPRLYTPSSTPLGATMSSADAQDDADRETLRELAGTAARLVAETGRRTLAGTETPEEQEGSGGAALVGRLRTQFAGDAPAEGALAWVGRAPDDARAVATLEGVLFGVLLRDRSFAEDVRRLVGSPSAEAGKGTVSINATSIGKATVFNEDVQVAGDFTIN